MPVPVRVVQGHADDLVVDALLVLHLEQRHRLDRYQAPGERRLGQAHERVERVSVQPERVAQIAVVGGIGRSGLQQPVELDPAEALVVLVLVASPLGDLDHADEGVLG